MTKLLAAAGLISASLVIHAARLNDPQATAGSAPKPIAAAAAERLGVFEGVWTRSDLPAGTTFEDTCAWLPGARRHLVCHQRFASATTRREQMAVYSYRNTDSTYLLTVFLSGGQVWRYEGGPEGERWIFNSISHRPDGAQRLRQALTPTADAIRFVEEVSENGGTWRLTDPSEDYRYVRVK